jgi:hypothetical protein
VPRVEYLGLPWTAEGTGGKATLGKQATRWNRRFQFPTTWTFGGGDRPSPGSSLELGEHHRPDDYRPRLAEPNDQRSCIPDSLRHRHRTYALTVPPFPLVMFELQDEADSGDPLFVFFPVQSGRRPGVAGVESAICCWREPSRSGMTGGAESTLFIIRCEPMTRGYWAGNCLSTKKGPDWRPSSLHRCKGVQCLETTWRCGPPLRRGGVGGVRETEGAGITANVRRGDLRHYQPKNRGWGGTGMKDTIGGFSIGWKETGSGWEHG